MRSKPFGGRGISHHWRSEGFSLKSATRKSEIRGLEPDRQIVTWDSRCNGSFFLSLSLTHTHTHTHTHTRACAHTRLWCFRQLQVDLKFSCRCVELICPDLGAHQSKQQHSFMSERTVSVFVFSLAPLLWRRYGQVRAAGTAWLKVTEWSPSWLMETQRCLSLDRGQTLDISSVLLVVFTRFRNFERVLLEMSLISWLCA